MSITPTTYEEFEQWWADYLWYRYKDRYTGKELFLVDIEKKYRMHWMNNALWGRPKPLVADPRSRQHPAMPPEEFHAFVEYLKSQHAQTALSTARAMV